MNPLRSESSGVVQMKSSDIIFLMKFEEKKLEVDSPDGMLK